MSFEILITPTAGNDTLVGGDGNDTINGLAGDDSIDGGRGNDSLIGGAGNDTLVGGPADNIAASDTLLGGDGNDVLSPAFGFASMSGGAGADRFVIPVPSPAGGGGRYVISDFSWDEGDSLGNLVLTGGQRDLDLDGDGSFDDSRHIFSFSYYAGGGGRPIWPPIPPAIITLFVTLDLLNFGLFNGVRLSGTTDNDSLSGGSLDDELYGRTGDDTLFGLEGRDTLSGHEGSDSLIGGDGNDRLLGGGGNDYLVGGAGNDHAEGGDGADTIIGGAGDTIIGGDGIDVADLSAIGANILIDLSSLPSGLSRSAFAAGGTVGSISDVEVIFLGSSDDIVVSALGVTSVHLGAGNDWITDSSWGNNDIFSGGDGNDALYGRVGNDLLQGDAGDDILIGGFGDDVLDGGAGLSDRVSFWEALSAVNVNLQFGRAGGEGTDTIQNVEGAEGSNFNDTLVGLDSIGGLLSGLAGADSITGGAGNDTLIGGAGDDTLIANDGDDSVVGGVGDILFGGEGIDVADLTSLTVGATVDTANAYVLIGGAFRTFSGFEDVRMGSGPDVFIGGSGLRSVDLGAGNDWIADYSTGNNDVFFGGLGDDALYGRAGNDRLSGDAGNDILIGGLGNDTLDGGAGSSDRVSYWEAASGVSVNLQAGVATGEGTDSIVNVEGVEGSSFNDTLVGLDSIGSLLSGLAGADNIVGGAGNDTLSGGLGDDTLNGSAGIGDRISYRAAAGAVSVNLQTGLAVGEGTDTILNVEGVDGSDFADTLVGGGGGDFFDGGRGSDVITGGAGVDTASWAGLTANLVGNAAQGVLGDGMDFDSVSEIEVWRLGSGNDIFVGWFGTREVWLGGGNDWIADYSPGNNDMFYGEAGNDALYGLGGDDMLVGGDGTDILIGGLGNDTLIGGKGGDWMQGGSGADRFVFAYEDSLDGGGALVSSWVDAVADFTRNTDRIDLSAIDANTNIAGDQAFTFVTTFTRVAGQLRVQSVGASGHPAVVFGDIDGDGNADFQIWVYLNDGGTTLTANDFIL